MEKIKAKVEQVLHKDNHDTTHTGTTGTTHGTTHTGTGHTTGTTHTGAYGSDPTGPHDSRLGNKADPRVDSDRVGGYGNTTSAGGATTGGLTGHSTTKTHGSDPTGPHDSKLANKLDPRVDSDRVGGYGNTASAGGYGSTTGNTTGHTTGHTTTGGLGGRSDPTGPHDSHLANKADPRVDSDRVGGYGNTASTGGYGTTTGHSTTGGLGGRSDPTGPHDSHLANKADPRVDSDRVGGYGNTASTGGYGTTTGHSTTGGIGSHNTHNGGIGGGPGPAPNTAGPHSSNLLNKADPRVDSDLDGSKTYGGNKTQGY